MSDQSDHEFPPPETTTDEGIRAPGVEDATTFGPAGAVPPQDSHIHPGPGSRPGSFVRPAQPLAYTVTWDAVDRPAPRNGARNKLPLRIPAALPISKPFKRSTWDWSRLTRLCILAGVMGSVLSVLVITLDGLLRPGYSAVSNAISDMGERPFGWVLNKDLIVTGLLFMPFAIGVRGVMGNALGRKSVNVMTMLFLLAGAGIALDGVFTEYKALDLHLLGFYTAFSALTLAFFLVGVQLARLQGDRRLRWRRYGWYSLFTGLVVVLLVTVYVALPTWATDVQGLIERLIVGAAFAWQIVTAFELLKPRARTAVVEGDAHPGEHSG